MNGGRTSAGRSHGEDVFQDHDDAPGRGLGGRRHRSGHASSCGARGRPPGYHDEVRARRRERGPAVGVVDRVRCAWAGAEPLLTYHDEEWGRPVTDERGLFERLCLEAFQSGLSWTTILRKREGFRRAFADFEPDAVARFRQVDVERLLGDASIVRNHAKIDAAIANARATVTLRGTGVTLPDLVWSFRPAPTPAPATLADVPATTTESAALAKELKQRGFRFVGPTTVHALMEACGVVNDHVEACFVRDEVAAEQELAAKRTRRSAA